jgi:hypothetical protein
MKEFRNKGWDNLHKMEEIFPIGGATGVGSHRGTALNRAIKGSPQSATSLLGVFASYGTNNPGVGLSETDQQAVAEAANVVSMAVQSLTNISPSILPLPANLSVPSESASSRKNKCPLSSLSHEDPESGSHSMLFSPAHVPVSTLSTASSVPSKCSRTSAQAKTTKQSNTTTVALHAVDSSIRHLSDSIASTLLDPLVVVGNATKALYSIPEMPAEHWRFMTKYFSQPTTSCAAVIFTSLPNDDARLVFVSDLYAEYGPAAASTSTSSGA